MVNYYEDLYESNRNYAELCTNTYMKATKLYESNRNYGELCTKDLYESNRNYGELCTKTYMKAIETMVNYTRRPI